MGDAEWKANKAKRLQFNRHTSARKVYRFEEDYGRGYGVEGVFTAHPEDVVLLIGKNVNFGEISGKHSEIDMDVKPDTFQVVDAPPEVLVWIEANLGHNIRGPWDPFDSYTIGGHNPLGQFDEDDEEPWLEVPE